MQPVTDLQRVEVTLSSLRLVSAESKIQFSPFRIELTKTAPSCRVLGASGAGKTTFFKSLIRRFHDDWRDHSTEVDIQVTVRANGVELNGHDGAIGYAAQRPFFMPHKTVVQNLSIPFAWTRADPPTEAAIDECITDFELNGLRERRAYQLSAGERQRLNLARMFVANPPIAIIDECLSPMDEEMATKIGDVIAQRYSTRSMILITGHRSADLRPFSHLTCTLSYSDDRSGSVPVRNVIATTT